MKAFTLSFILLAVSGQLFADASYGFLNQDISYNTCFVGIDAGTRQFSGVVSNRFLSAEQRASMQKCQLRKERGQTAVIKVWTTPNTQKLPNGVTTHFPDFHVKCVKFETQKYSQFLVVWRSVVGKSNFRRCF